MAAVEQSIWLRAALPALAGRDSLQGQPGRSQEQRPDLASAVLGATSEEQAQVWGCRDRQITGAKLVGRG